MKNNKLLIITDSVSMPRPGIPYESTWIYKLKKEFPNLDIIDKAARGSTSMRLVTEGGGGVDLLETYMPDIVILQIGITECAPRLFKKHGVEYFFMNKILTQKLRQKYIDYIKLYRVRKAELADVPPVIFKKNLQNYCKRANDYGTKVLIIKILKATDLYIKKSPNIQQSIDLYNSIIDSVAAEFVNVTTLSPLQGHHNIDELCIDELHINKAGHELYFLAISNRIKTLFLE